MALPDGCSPARGLLAVLPNEGPKFVPISAELLTCSISRVADIVRRALSDHFGFGEDDDFRLLYRERDIDEEGPAAALVKSIVDGTACTVRVLFRLLGGKGGFGAMLRKQGKQGKKTTNFDAQRDLSGRRLRHSKAVERIKEWMEQQKRDDELVKLITGEGPDLPKAPDPNDSLDPEYVRKMQRASASLPKVVKEGIQRREEGPEDETKKRARVSADSASASSARGGSFLSALDMLSSPEPDDDSEDSGKKRSTAAGSGSASCAAAAADESDGEEY